MLLAALGLVLAAMRQLNDPGTAHRLGQVFSLSAETTAPRAAESSAFVVATALDESSQLVSEESGSQQNSLEPPSSDADDSLAQVKDNTYFRPAESKAWFELFDRLQYLDSEKLRELTVGELTYAQLLKQPQVYRGKVVTLRGTLRREEIETAPENDLGIESYHRLIIQPRGGGNWPFVVYCLSLPDQLPRGDNFQSRISVTGFFFKNWSYAWQDGLGVAPVVLASQVEWQTSTPDAPRRTLGTLGLSNILAVACGFAILVVWIVLRNTQRPQRSVASYTEVTLPNEEMLTDTVDQRLQRLSEGETPR